jgi:hypothetical protein
MAERRDARRLREGASDRAQSLNLQSGGRFSGLAVARPLVALPKICRREEEGPVSPLHWVGSLRLLFASDRPFVASFFDRKRLKTGTGTVGRRVVSFLFDTHHLFV